MFVRTGKTAEDIHSAMKKPITETYVRHLVGRNLKRIRTMQNKSQLGLALESGLTHNFINDIENFKKGISIKTIAKISAALKVEPHQFFLPEEDMHTSMHVYVNDFNDSLQKMVKELTDQYLLP